MAENTAAPAVAETACECSLFDALDSEQLTEENLASGDYDVFTTGCTATTKRTFAPGHDAKLKSFFIKHDALGHEIRRTAGGMAVSADAMSHASRYEFAHLVAAGIDKATAKAEARAARALTRTEKLVKRLETTHDGNEARQGREAKNLTERVAAEEAKHAAEQVASRPAPEWDDIAAPEGFVEVARVQDSVVYAEPKSVGLTDEPKGPDGKEGTLQRRGTAKVGRWTYRGEFRLMADEKLWFCYTDKKGVAQKTRNWSEEI